MKLWDKGVNTSKEIERFTVGNDRDLDLQLALYDVLGSIGHAKMLHQIGVLKSEEFSQLEATLGAIKDRIEEGDFLIEPEFEDVHSKVEFMLTQELGEIGKKIHTARSRNDQVLVDVKLFLKDKNKSIIEKVETLFNLLIDLSNEHKEDLMPGYTHFQVAMPSSFGLWFGGFAETLVDDLRLIVASHKIIDQNPLGSAAGYGSSFPIDRESTTLSLGFADLHVNSIAAQMSRFKTDLAFANGMSSLAQTIAKMAMDLCLFNSQNFDFIYLPEELTTGSSIMPHKKNPDVLELVRGKCNKVLGLPNQINLLVANLPTGYHREMQLLKELIFPAITDVISCLDIMVFLLKNIRVKQNLLDLDKYQLVFSVEEVNKLVKEGTPFREAYKVVAGRIKDGDTEFDRSLNHTHIGSLGNLGNDRIKQKFNRVINELGN